MSQKIKMGSTQESRNESSGDVGCTISLPNFTLCSWRRFARSWSATGAVAYTFPSLSVNRIWEDEISTSSI